MADGKPLYNPNDGLTGRDGGPYLDEEEARVAEIRRAKIEGREPDLNSPPASAGIQLSTADQLIRTVEVNRPSQIAQTGPNARRMFENAAADKDTLLTVRGNIPDAVNDEKPADNVSGEATNPKEQGTDLFDKSNPVK